MSSEPHQESDWSGLVRLMSDRIGSLAEHVLDNLRDLLDAGRRIVNCSESGLLVPNAEGTHMRFLVSVNSKPGIDKIIAEIAVPCDRSLVGYVFNTGQLIAIANPDDFYQEVDQKTGLKTNTYLATPIESAGEVLGVVTFVNRPGDQPQEPFNESEIEAGTKLADLAAATLKYYRRMLLQHRLFNQELISSSETFASGGLLETVDAPDTMLDELEEQSPLARTMVQLERMTRREQDLAAELISVLSSYADEDETGL